MQNAAVLPPADRTVGQLVAETIRLYGRNFWPSLSLGAVVAVFDQIAIGRPVGPQSVLLAAATPFFTLAYMGACLIAAGRRPRSRGAAVTAFAVGVVIFLPVGLLIWIFVLPTIAWLAVLGLSVPVALFEDSGFRESMRRARRLATAGYIHVFGSLATLGIVYFVSRTALLLLLHGQADSTLRTAAFLADLVLSPILFLGSALLYFDQKARQDEPRVSRR